MNVTGAPSPTTPSVQTRKLRRRRAELRLCSHRARKQNSEDSSDEDSAFLLAESEDHLRCGPCITNQLHGENLTAQGLGTEEEFSSKVPRLESTVPHWFLPPIILPPLV